MALLVSDVPARPVSTGRRPASRAEQDRRDRRLLERYHRHGDTAAREQLASEWLDVAASLARRYRPSSDARIPDDVLGAAAMGVAKAIDRYDLSRANTFGAFAVATVLGELRRHFRDHEWGMRVPRSLQQRGLDLQKALPRLTQELGRSPTIRELADELGVTVEEALEASDLDSARRPDSLQRGLGDDPDATTVEDVVGCTDPDLDSADARTSLEAARGVLPPRDRRILELYFLEDLSQSEVAERIGLSQMQVSRVIRRSLDVMRPLYERDQA
jgi:RNA polymerase sigma-B factor